MVGHWIQGIAGENRRHLRLNGEEVTELDFSNMNVHLLYSQIDERWDQGDAYDIGGTLSSPLSRELGKYGFLIAMSIANRRGFGRALKEQIRRKGYPESQINGRYGFNSMRVRRGEADAKQKQGRDRKAGHRHGTSQKETRHARQNNRRCMSFFCKTRSEV